MNSTPESEPTPDIDVPPVGDTPSDAPETDGNVATESSPEAVTDAAADVAAEPEGAEPEEPAAEEPAADETPAADEAHEAEATEVVIPDPDPALLEAHDLAFGTSRWSSKLVHGGLRYLAKGDVKLAHESAVERGVLMTRTAPHLTRTLPMLFPLHAGANHFVMAGLKAGNALRIAAGTPASVLPRPRRVPKQEALALVPGLSPDRLTGGLLNYDGQLIDDARLVVALARTAAGYGARIITRAKVVVLQGDGAEVHDTLTGTTFTVRAKAVINATGV